jgi:type I restriction enzyme S subunit
MDAYINNDFKETEVGPIPADWDVAQLSDVLLKTKNYDPTRAPNEEFSYIDVSSVSNELNRVIGYQVLLGRDAPSRARKHVRGKDTLFATVRPYLKNIAQVPEELDNSVCSTGYCVLRANSKWLDADFLFYAVLFDEFVDRIVQYQRGSSYPAVSDKVVKEERVPLPPLPEQRRIAAVLNAIQQDIAAQEDIIAEAREFKRSLMQRLFTYGPGPAETKETEVGEIPAHWEIAEFEGMCDFLQYGTSQRCDYDMVGNPVLRIPNVVGGEVDAEDLKYTELPAETVESLLLETGDLLFVRTNGNREYSGRSAVYKGYPPNVLFASYLSRARLKQDELLPDFVQAYTELPMGKRFLSGRALETADGKFNINMQTIGTMLVPVAPIPEQEEITVLLADAGQKLAAEEDRRAALSDVFTSALHQLMTGQIRLLSDEGVPL